MARADSVLTWWVIDTPSGLWIEQADSEPQTAVAGPYLTHQDALDKMRRIEVIDSRNGQAAGFICIAWVVLLVVGAVTWAFS